MDMPNRSAASIVLVDDGRAVPLPGAILRASGFPIAQGRPFATKPADCFGGSDVEVSTSTPTP